MARVTTVLYLSKYWLHIVAVLELNLDPHSTTVEVFLQQKTASFNSIT